MRPYASDRIAVVGNIEITVATSEGGLVGKGELILDSDDLSGKYIVLLHVKKPLPYDMPPHKGV